MSRSIRLASVMTLLGASLAVAQQPAAKPAEHAAPAATAASAEKPAAEKPAKGKKHGGKKHGGKKAEKSKM